MYDVKNYSSRFKGLSKDEVEKSKLKYGENKISKNKRKTFGKQYLESFGDPTIKILLLALGLNVIFFIKHFNWYESVGIAVSIMLATLVSSISEYGSQLAFEKLMADAQKIKCRVWREGDLKEMMVCEVVVGDFVQLQSGDKIPADGVLVFGQIDVDQSSLNGETSEAHKFATSIMNETHCENSDFLDPHMLFSSSVICRGEGVMLVQTIGDNTFYGNLAYELREDKHDSPLKTRLTDLAKTISRFGYLGAILVFFASLFNSVILHNGYVLSDISIYISNPLNMLRDVLRALTLSITIIVVAVPEGLPVMITVVLSSNMKRMIKDNVLVRKLVGIETAGSLNILFTDKTGTITKGQLKVTKFISGDNKVYESAYSLKEFKQFWNIVYASCVYNNEAKRGYNGKKLCALGGNSTDRALLNFAMQFPTIQENIKKVSSIPFSSKNKYSTAKIAGDLNTTLLKGAPEKVLPYCTSYLDSDGETKIFDKSSYINSNIKNLSSKGARVLAIALSSEDVNENEQFSDLTLIGIICIKDEIRLHVSESIKEVRDAGIQIVMITGDAKDTATAIAQEAGLLDADDKGIIMTSDELNKLSDDQVKELLPSLKVVARAMPSDKSRLVRLSQSLDLVAGMTGDGVNDAPALKKADVGFAMGSGTEIAKEAGDIVILDDNFKSIGKAILYGRTIFKSIRKFIIFQLSINVCAVGISVIGQFIGLDTPITVIQMLWINMVMDTLAGLAFAGEAPLSEYMEETPKQKNEKIINKYMASQIFFTGIYTTVLCIFFLKFPSIEGLFRASPDRRFLMTGFFAFFMFSAIFNSLNARTQRINLLAHILKNKSFVIIMGFVFMIQLVMLYHGSSVFRAYGLTLSEFWAVISLSFTIIPADLMRKSFLRMKHSKKEIEKFL